MSLARCPICGRPFEADQSAAMPFCTKRCRRIDLQRWLDERYGLPWERDEEGEERPPDDPGS